MCGPAACGCCGHDLTGEPVLGTVQKRQVFEASPPPPPTVTEYQVAAKQCPECGEVSVGLAPAGVTGRVQYGPGVHAKAALAVCAHYLPVARAARLVAALTGVPGEWPGGVAPPGSRRTRREGLPSPGSHRPT